MNIKGIIFVCFVAAELSNSNSVLSSCQINNYDKCQEDEFTSIQNGKSERHIHPEDAVCIIS